MCDIRSLLSIFQVSFARLEVFVGVVRTNCRKLQSFCLSKTYNVEHRCISLLCEEWQASKARYNKLTWKCFQRTTACTADISICLLAFLAARRHIQLLADIIIMQLSYNKCLPASFDKCVNFLKNVHPPLFALAVAFLPSFFLKRSTWIQLNGAVQM